MPHLAQTFLSPHFTKTLLYYLSPLFVKILSNSPCLQPLTPNPKYLFLLFVSLGEWVIAPHLMCYFTLIWLDIMDLHMSSLGTLVPEGPCCVFYATRYQVYWNLIPCVFFASTLICYHTQTHKDISHSGTKRLTHPHRYVLSFVLTAAMCITLNG